MKEKNYKLIMALVIGLTIGLQVGGIIGSRITREELRPKMESLEDSLGLIEDVYYSSCNQGVQNETTI